jgi:hypothetical protein
MTSAYPVPVNELADRVRERAAELREWPSRNQVMKEFRVGGPKAAAALDALRADGFDPTVPADRPVPTLHAVPNLDTTSNTGTASGTASDLEAGPEGAGPDSPRPVTAPGTATVEVTDPADQPVQVSAPVTDAGDPGVRAVRVPRWPLLLIALGAFVSIWGGWVGLGELTGFGPIRLLPGIADQVVINSAITLPIGVEAYAAYAMWAWLAPTGAGVSATARRFACWSALAALVLGAGGQVAYHLMVAAGMTAAPWQITAFVSCLPVVVLGCGAALAHLIHREATR